VKDEGKEEKPLIREVSTHPPTDDKGRPTLPASLVERPPVPEINPKLREALSQPLTLADCQYAVNTLPHRIVEAFERVQKEKPAQVIPASESVREMQTAIDIMTEYMTKGYAPSPVEYTPPTDERTQSGGSLVDELQNLWSLFSEIKPELRDEIENTAINLLRLFNEKLGGK